MLAPLAIGTASGDGCSVGNGKTRQEIRPLTVNCANSDGARHVLVVEPVRHGEEHQPFNTSLLLSCLAAFPNARITFAAHPSHLETVQKSITNVNQLKFLPMELPPRHSRGVARLRGDWRLGRLLTRRLAEQPTDRLILTSVTTELIWALKANPASKQLPPALAILHGGLSEALRVPRYNLLARAASLRKALENAPATFRFAVLEHSILEMLDKRAPEVAKRVGVLPHPLPPDLLEARSQKVIKPDDHVRVGLLGLCTPQKGLFRFLELARHARETGVSKLRFEIVGRLHQDSVSAAEPYMKYLDRGPASGRVPRENFIEAMTHLHYGAFLFEGNHYDLTASGVLLDCVGLSMPLVKTDGPLVRSLETRVGPIGLSIADDPGEATNRILSESYDNYQEMAGNMTVLRDTRTPDAIACRIKAFFVTS